MIVQDGKYSLTFVYMGKFRSEGAWSHPRRENDTYELFFLTRGEAHLTVGGEKTVLRAGDVFVLPPHVPVEGDLESRDVSFFWVHFYAQNFGLFGFTRRTVHVPAYLSLFCRMGHLSDVGDTAGAETCLYSFFSEQKREDAPKNKLFADVSEYVRVHAADGARVSEIGAKFGYSADHLSRLFVSSCGLSLKEYLDRERLRVAEGLLLDTSLSLGEIARRCGFDCATSFFKFFRYHTALSPTDWRSKYYAGHTNRR